LLASIGEGCHYSGRISCCGSVVLVDEAAELVAALDFGTSRSGCRPVGVGWPELERAMRPLLVVVVDVDAQYPFVTAVRIGSQSRHSASTVLTKRSAIAFALAARTGVCTIRIPSLRKTSSKGPLYLLSRSRISKRICWSALRGDRGCAPAG
jgi:hypothetical protein